MKYTHNGAVTGNRNIFCRGAYSQHSDFGSGYIMACFGSLDSPLNGCPSFLSAGGSSAMAGIPGSAAYEREMLGYVESNVCTFRHCTCGGRGDTVHVRNA